MNNSRPLALACVPMLVLACSLFGDRSGQEPSGQVATEASAPTAPATPAASGAATSAAAPTPVLIPSAPAPPAGSQPPSFITDDWLDLQINTGGPACGILYPPDSTVETLGPDMTRMLLSYMPGTNLREKEVLIQTGRLAQCVGAYGPGSDPTETVAFGDGVFSRSEGWDAGAGSYLEWVSYVTVEQGVCVAFTFALHSGNPMFYDPPLPVFDRAAEAAVFEAIMSTFTWGAR